MNNLRYSNSKIRCSKIRYVIYRLLRLEIREYTSIEITGRSKIRHDYYKISRDLIILNLD